MEAWLMIINTKSDNGCAEIKAKEDNTGNETICPVNSYQSHIHAQIDRFYFHEDTVAERQGTTCFETNLTED